jgi:FkbM family methyltransferase
MGFSLQREHDRSDHEIVEAVTVDDVLRRAGQGSIFVLKIDIEGGEEYLFRDPSDWMDCVRVMFIEIHDWAFPGKRTR